MGGTIGYIDCPKCNDTIEMTTPDKWVKDEYSIICDNCGEQFIVYKKGGDKR